MIEVEKAPTRGSIHLPTYYSRLRIIPLNCLHWNHRLHRRLSYSPHSASTFGFYSVSFLAAVIIGAPIIIVVDVVVVVVGVSGGRDLRASRVDHSTGADSRDEPLKGLHVPRAWRIVRITTLVVNRHCGRDVTGDGPFAGDR